MLRCCANRDEELKRVLMARRLLAQSVLGGVFGRWIAFTEEVRRPLSPRASGGVPCLWFVEHIMSGQLRCLGGATVLL